jgi:NADH dehydrogenase
MFAPVAMATRPFSALTFGGPQKPSHIVVAGNGIGGMAVVSKLKQALQKRPHLANVTLIGPRPDFVFKPLLLDSLLAPQTASSWPLAEQLTHPNAPIQFRQGNITALSLPPHGQVQHNKSGPIDYDYLVVALGYVKPPVHRVPGLHQHALFVETPQDIAKLEASLLQKLDHALKAPPDSETRRQNLSFVILGGGVTGVETALLLHERLQRELQARKADPAIQSRITLVHGSPDILNDPYFLPLQGSIKRQMEEVGIELLLRHWVVGVEAHQVQVQEAETGAFKSLATRDPISTLGGVPNPVAESFAEPNQRVAVNPFLELPQHPQVYVIGDLANAQDATGRPLPMLGQVAAQQGRYVAQDLVQKLSGAPSPRSPFVYKHRGVTLPLTPKRAVFQFKLPWGQSLILQGRLAAWLRNAVYRAQVRQLTDS